MRRVDQACPYIMYHKSPGYEVVWPGRNTPSLQEFFQQVVIVEVGVTSAVATSSLACLGCLKLVFQVTCGTNGKIIDLI